VVPTGLEAPVAGEVVEEAGGYSLWELADAQPLATMNGDAVGYVDNVREALELATAPGFDPWKTVIAERAVDVTPPAEPRALEGTIASASPTEIRIRLDPPTAGLLTIRNAYEAGWRATSDGRSAETIPVDGFLEGVVLPSRVGTVVLTYHDDSVMLGLALGAVLWSVLLVTPFLTLLFERRPSSRRAATGRTTPRRSRRSLPQPPAA
jgi:hypothetical protein